MPAPKPKLALAQDAEADKLLSKDPLALLIGMVLDQQIPLEWAFKGPYSLKQRIGHLEAADIAAMDPDALAAAFSKTPAIHRFPAANAKRVQELCRIVVEQYGGKADRVWRSATSGDELYRNIKALPGFGEQKARIFIALLGKQLGVDVPGWQEAAGDFGRPGTAMSVADITDAASLGQVRQYKQERKAAARAAAAAEG
ncbi:MAG TPA: HhH-GPD-type base excision DNA repair protein [Acidimicrobiales bacterium]|nr:HhH-GPD-type base excision DNA repair protein [Acidimicrobiales bacterium]